MTTSALGPASSFRGLERQVFDFIVDHLEKHTYQPSVREICAHFGIRSTKTVSDLLQNMAAMGLIEVSEGRSRAVRLRGVSVRIVRKAAST